MPVSEAETTGRELSFTAEGHELLLNHRSLYCRDRDAGEKAYPIVGLDLVAGRRRRLAEYRDFSASQNMRGGVIGDSEGGTHSMVFTASLASHNEGQMSGALSPTSTAL